MISITLPHLSETGVSTPEMARQEESHIGNMPLIGLVICTQLQNMHPMTLHMSHHVKQIV
jgi:hypothetical protein